MTGSHSAAKGIDSMQFLILNRGPRCSENRLEVGRLPINVQTGVSRGLIERLFDRCRFSNGRWSVEMFYDQALPVNWRFCFCHKVTYQRCFPRTLL